MRVYPVVAEMARCRGLGARPIDIIAADTVAEIGLLWLIEVMAFGRPPVPEIEMTAVLIRIALRYLSGFLIAKGILGAEYDLSADPELVTLIGVAIGAITEAFYIAARRLGWAK